MSKIVLYSKKVDKYTVECTSDNQDDDITKFVAGIYYNKPHYKFEDEFNVVLETMLEEDKFYTKYSTTITIYDEDNEIQGTISKIFLTKEFILPVEREFNINLLSIVKENLPINNIYEIARFANKNNDIKALKILLTELTANGNINDLFLASLDSKVLMGLRKLGFTWYDIGEPKEYLGSLTCPVAVSVGKIKGAFSYQCTSKHRSIGDEYENAI